MTINGRLHGWTRSTISYEDIERTTAMHRPSVMYRYKDTGAGGILHPGDRLAVTPDLVINAAAMNNA